MAYIGIRARRTHIYRLLFMSEYYSREAFGEVMENYFSMLEIPPDQEDRDYICPKLERLLDMKEELDSLISHYSENWKINRMSKTDLCALRLGFFLSGYDDEMPAIPAFVEVVNLAKDVGGNSSGAFVNGILGRYLEDNPQLRDKVVHPVSVTINRPWEAKAPAEEDLEELPSEEEALTQEEMGYYEEEIDYYSREQEEKEKALEGTASGQDQKSQKQESQDEEKKDKKQE